MYAGQSRISQLHDNYLTTKVKSLPRTEDGSAVTLLLPVQNVTADSGSRVFSHTFYGFAGHWFTLRSVLGYLAVRVRKKEGEETWICNLCV